MFAIIGVQLFKGTFFSCNDPSRMTEMECRGEFITFEDGDPTKPVSMKRVWQRADFHFVSFLEREKTLIVDRKSRPNQTCAWIRILLSVSGYIRGYPDIIRIAKSVSMHKSGLNNRGV